MCQNRTVDSNAQLFIGMSTKAYLGPAATTTWLEAARDAFDARPELASLGIQPFVAPSSPMITEARAILAGTPCWVGAQDGQWQTGAATGAVSMTMLAELGMDFVELGHAERRRLFGEDDDEIRRKADAASAAGLRVLLCIGEPDRASAEDAARRCLEQVLAVAARGGIPLDRLILAYEPWWAIGAESPAEPDYVNAVIRGVRAGLGTTLEGEVLGILYGGSAGPGTLAPLTEADGLFLGRFAHVPANFARVLDDAIERRRN
jgi:triosephosphate isomerase